MDGDALEVVAPAGMTSYASFEAGTALVVEADVEDRLADLGYME